MLRSGFFPQNTLGDGPAFWIFFPGFKDNGFKGISRKIPPCENLKIFLSKNDIFVRLPVLIRVALYKKCIFSKQEMQRKLEPNVKWISDMAIHSSGDHIIVGDYSTRLAWIDTGESYYMTSFHDM